MSNEKKQQVANMAGKPEGYEMSPETFARLDNYIRNPFLVITKAKVTRKINFVVCNVACLSGKYSGRGISLSSFDADLECLENSNKFIQFQDVSSFANYCGNEEVHVLTFPKICTVAETLDTMKVLCRHLITNHLIVIKKNYEIIEEIEKDHSDLPSYTIHTYKNLVVLENI